MPPQLKSKSKRNRANRQQSKTKRKSRTQRHRKSIPSSKHRDKQLSPDVSLLVDLVDDPQSTLEDKLHRLEALHARWEYEDLEEAVEGLELVFRQKHRCKEVGLIVFGFTLHEGEQKDLLLLAKTGFGKSLIFQLLPFMTSTIGVVLILMPLKLLQAEQFTMINQRLPKGNAIVLNGDNNKETTQCEIAPGNYTHVLTSPEIVLSKKFKKNVLDQHVFTDRLCLLAIDEIHLVEEWGKQFRPLYAEIEKVRKRIPNHVPLVGVSATLTPDVRSKVINKAGFLPTYNLMQTSLDRPEIMQIHRFMEHTKSSGLHLQFVLPKIAKEAKDIQKTVIFENSVTEIRPIINIFQSWMRHLGYPEESSKWVRPYYSAISDLDKALTAAAFATVAEDNQECVMIVATDAYGMGIDNPDVKLVIQWDIPMSFDSMIQRIIIQ